MNIALTIIYILVSLILTGVVLFQQGKDPREASAIMGSTGSFFSKNKGATRDAILEKLTAVAAILFVLLSVIMFVFVK